ncbi:peptide-methionine (S)-S-oxide reductase MsrA [Salinarimonas soli]|uniref:Peptide methionine sulfoxide reductase MsrA n=1 Tax=Salinarimonas soli TaxID=1638099 RepID=A0A5B2VBA1_9HYPH|nr:peptide-methionine (S)-S-oxide reductase MsrA [Salinarimonas soli]KAA2235692.1 peptide-methionine (S)-S-oxide reductase MsrA [Salinarimonas soli]
MKRAPLLAVLAFLSACGLASAGEATKAAPPPPPGLAAATFAGGCFWCMEPPFDKLPGVVSTTSGYTDGTVPGPTYEQVSAGRTGHTEAVRVVYDPAKVSYETLLSTYWANVDPVDARGQFCDKGTQYRPGIYTHDAEQARLAAASKTALTSRFTQPITVEVKPATAFYEAEDYHQDYYQKNPVKYRYYRFGCGRDARLEAVWGTPKS